MIGVLRLLLLVVGFFGVACASAPRLVVPTGPGAPFPGYEAALEAAVAPCRQVRTMEMELTINGYSGDRRVRGRVRGAIARPASLRLEGVAPFGPPAFVLVANPPADAALVLPRERRVVTHADGGDLLGSLTGLVLAADDFQAVLTGCLVPDPRPVGGRAYRDEWRAVELEGGATIFLRPVEGVLAVVAGTRPGMRVEYADHVRGLPRRVRVLTTDGLGVETDLAATLAQVSINTTLHDDVFGAPIRDEYDAMTLDQFRATVGPLEVSPEDTASPQ